MLKREDLTSENIDQIVADAHKAGYHFFLSAAEREASFKTAMERLSARRGALGLRLRLADVESGHRVRRAAALPRRRLAPFLLLLDADGPRHARAARPDAGARAGRGLRGHRLSAGAAAGRERARPPVESRDAGRHLPARLDPDEAARRPHRHRHHLRRRHRRTASIAATCRSSGRRITSPSPRAAAAPAATISPTPPLTPARSHIHDPYIEELVERVSDLRDGTYVIPTVQTDGEAVGEA